MRSRIYSLADQAVASVTTLVISVSIARFFGPSILGEYVVLFGISFLLLRVHAALVCMPLATEMVTDADQIWKAYAGMHIVFLLVTAPISAVIAWLVTVLVLQVPISVFDIICISGAAAGLVTQEFVRRWLLYAPRPLAALSFGVALASIALTCLFSARNISLSGAGIFLLVSAGVAPAILYFTYRVWRAGANVSLSLHRSSVVRNVPLLTNNLLLWTSSQFSNYVVFLYLGASQTGILGVVRSLFGPLNVILLSLEGFLPKSFMTTFTMHGLATLMKMLKTEAQRVSVIMVIVSAFAILFGDVAIVGVFGERYRDMVSHFVIVGFCGIYLCAFISRIYFIGLRTVGYAKDATVAAAWATGMLVVDSLVLVPVYGLNGAVAAIFIMEFMLMILTVISTKNRGRSMEVARA